MLLFSNLPYNCSERELREFVESGGVEILSVRIIRDTAAGVSPAFGDVELKDRSKTSRAIAALDGLRLRNRTVHVREATALPMARSPWLYGYGLKVG